MYLITGGVGFLACVIFILIVIISAVRGKNYVVPLVAFILSLALFLGSGFLYSRTDPQVGGTVFLEYITRNQTVPPNLTGQWKETVGDHVDSFHGVYISDHTIEIYWVSDGGKSRTLYWAGTFDPPTDGQEPYTWTSQNDTRRTSAALLAAGDSTKDFTYKNGKISYPASVLGVTTEIQVEKADWGFLDPVESPPEDSNPTTPSTPAPETIASGDLEQFHVEIKSAALTRDFEDHPALVVTCSWTNNSQDTLSAAAALTSAASQNDAPLEPAMVIASDLYNPETNTRDMLPGTSVDIQYAFLLADETSPVTFQLTAASGSGEVNVPAVIDPASLAAAGE